MGITTKVKHALTLRGARERRRLREPGKWEFPDSGPDGGVREPRRPRGNPPGDTIALTEPK